MSASRTALLTGLLTSIPVLAHAQLPAAKDQPVLILQGQRASGTAMPATDEGIFVHGLLDQFEGRVTGPSRSFRWEGEAWAGTDYDKLWLKSEGFVQGNGKVEDGRYELLYDRAITTYFNLQAGVRSDLDSGTGRTWAALGVQGLAPQWFEVEATAYLSDRGHAAARLGVSYDLLITQRLILQPEVEMNFYSKADPGRGVGSGLSDIDAGLRLRYEISRKFAPYFGVAYDGKFGQTASLARQEGEAAGAVQLLFGIRSWF